MKNTILVFAELLLIIVATIAAAYLCFFERNGWGWFLFAAIIFCALFYKNLEDKE